jgi:hypothetical protein
VVKFWNSWFEGGPQVRGIFTRYELALAFIESAGPPDKTNQETWTLIQWEMDTNTVVKEEKFN